MTTILEKNAPKESGAKNLHRDEASHFATAAVDIWLRGVHSFLISTALTEASPIWASVRNIILVTMSSVPSPIPSVTFSYFVSRRLPDWSTIQVNTSAFFETKERLRVGEHQLYWRLVKATKAFEGDDLFTDNNQEADEFDVRHRNHANYSDHLFQYPQFFVAKEDTIKNRIEHISKIAVDTAPLPRIDKFPDLEYVQLIAYHRIVRFRRLLDDVLEGKNAFWERHRTPDFASGYIDFQLTEGTGLAQPTTQ